MLVADLRIGNYVQNTKGDVLKISLLNNEDADKEIRGWQIKNPAFGSSNEFIKPIPLTEEWLLMFGFQLFASGYFCLNLKSEQKYLSFGAIHHKKINLVIEDKGTTLSIELPHIEYVHQLQNLYYALTNEELTIKNKEV